VAAHGAKDRASVTRENGSSSYPCTAQDGDKDIGSETRSGRRSTLVTPVSSVQDGGKDRGSEIGCLSTPVPAAQFGMDHGSATPWNSFSSTPVASHPEARSTRHLGAESVTDTNTTPGNTKLVP